MKIINQTLSYRNKEKHYTNLIIQNLLIIEKKKLYCDYKYPSMFKFLTRYLNYSDAEASIRVNTVRLMLKSDIAKAKVESGELSLSNASLAERTINNNPQIEPEMIIEKAATTNKREFEAYIQRELNQERVEKITLREFQIKKFDRLREKYGKDMSTNELIDMLLEKELRAPKINNTKRRSQNVKNTKGRYISKKVKEAIYDQKCANCGVRSNLEYDHIKKISHFGNNRAENIQILCRSCNQRKEIKARETGFFT